jgi:thiol-disulfide isomerase/thioredoxin
LSILFENIVMERRVSVNKALLLALVIVLVAMLVGCSPQTTPTPNAPPAAPGAGPTPLRPTATLGAALGPQPATAAPQPTRPPNPKQPVPPKIGDVAYDFTLRTLQGQTMTLSDLRGKKVMINFWATWCGPCRAEIPFMVTQYEALRGKGFEIVAVNLREDTTKITPFVEQFKMRFPILLDPNGEAGAAYFVRAIPTSVFVNEQGLITDVHIGSLTEEALRAALDRLMK